MSKNIKDAVSIIFTFKDEVFVIKRQNHLRSFPGYLAFVGGKVDKEDYEKADHLLKEYAQYPTHLINALYREVAEETAIQLHEVKQKSISYIGNALSPDFNPVRFNTYFFKVELDEKIEFTLDEYEIEKGWGERPTSILNNWSHGEHLIVPPIRYYLSELAQDIKSTNELNYIRRTEEDKVPLVETISELIQYMPLSNTLPPADRTNAFYIRGELKTLVDPSPKDEHELERTLNTIDPIDQILITHYHRDHYQFTDQIAKRLGVKVIMSEDTYDLILKHRPKGYFDGIEVKFVKDLDKITTWKSQDVRVYEVPGHAKGHIALAPSNMNWFIAGDLFQGVGSVVVGGENASMKKYCESLQRVIDLNPKCVIPSHGIALGGVGIIKKNLAHRFKREKQILELFLKYQDLEEVYNKVYFGLDKRLKPYAMANIESHLEKLKLENKVSY